MPLVVLAALLGGPAVAAASVVAAQLVRPHVPWRRRAADIGVCGLQAMAVGLLATLAGSSPEAILLATLLSFLAAALVAAGCRDAAALAERRRGLRGRRLARGLLLDLAESLVATPVVAALVVTARESGLLATAAVAALLGLVAIARHARASSVTALAHERAAARRDQLTGAPNRRGFEEALALAHARVARGEQPAGLFVVDIDRFKSINDRFGHQVGDEVIVTVVDRLRGGLRGCDLVARWGGEEIMVLAPGIAGLDALSRFGERIRALVGTTPVATRAHAILITVSVGGTLLDGATPPQVAVRTADGALYDAKRTRDTTVIAPSPRLSLRLHDGRRAS